MTDAIRELFQRLSREGQRVNLQPEGWERAFTTRFWKVEGDIVVLKLEAGMASLALERNAESWAVFENMGRIRTFRTRVLSVVNKPDGSPAAVRLLLPTVVGSEDRRQAYRVPALPKAELKSALVSGRRTWRPNMRNLSVTGALIQLPSAVAEALSEDARYVMMLEIDGQMAKINCVIVRRENDGRCALIFPGAMRLGEVVPPPDLARIVRLCEMHWLRKRSGKENAA